MEEVRGSNPLLSTMKPRPTDGVFVLAEWKVGIDNTVVLYNNLKKRGGEEYEVNSDGNHMFGTLTVCFCRLRQQH